MNLQIVLKYFKGLKRKPRLLKKKTLTIFLWVGDVDQMIRVLA